MSAIVDDSMAPNPRTFIPLIQGLDLVLWIGGMGENLSHFPGYLWFQRIWFLDLFSVDNTGIEYLPIFCR
jgi:hypothetical protein